MASYAIYDNLVAANGGNSIRFWLHPVGAGSTPKWDGHGYIIGTDNANTLISELRLVEKYLTTLLTKNYLKFVKFCNCKFLLDCCWTTPKPKMF